MLIHFEGRDYEYDPGLIDVGVAVKVREHTGLGIRSWEKAIDDADPLALQALYWVIKRQAGETVGIKSLNFSVIDFYKAIESAGRKELLDRLVAKAAAGELGADEAQVLAILRGETVEEEEADPTVTADA